MVDLRAAFLDESIDGLKAVRRLERTAQHRVHAESMQRQRLLEDVDALYLPLEKGENELWMAVGESFGGWGIKARFDDVDGIEIE